MSRDRSNAARGVGSATSGRGEVIGGSGGSANIQLVSSKTDSSSASLAVRLADEPVRGIVVHETLAAAASVPSSRDDLVSPSAPAQPETVRSKIRVWNVPGPSAKCQGGGASQVCLGVWKRGIGRAKIARQNPCSLIIGRIDAKLISGSYWPPKKMRPRGPGR